MGRLAAVGVGLVIVVAGACGGDSTPLESGAPTGTSVAATVPATAPPATDPAPEIRGVPLGQEFVIDVGESVGIAGEGLTVTYVALLADSALEEQWNEKSR